MLKKPGRSRSGAPTMFPNKVRTLKRTLLRNLHHSSCEYFGHKHISTFRFLRHACRCNQTTGNNLWCGRRRCVIAKTARCASEHVCTELQYQQAPIVCSQYVNGGGQTTNEGCIRARGRVYSTHFSIPDREWESGEQSYEQFVADQMNAVGYGFDY